MEKINFIIGSNGNIGKSLVKYELQSNDKQIIGIDKLESDINHSKYWHWKCDCIFPEKIESKLSTLFKKRNFKVKNLVLCAVMDSVPSSSKKDNYDYGLSNQEFAQINKRVLVNITSQMYILKIFEPYLYSESSVCLFSSIYGVKSPDQRIYEENFTKPLEYSASKSSILGMTKHFAITSALSNKGRCNCIVLGGMENDNQTDIFKKNYLKKVPLGRMANINDVLNAYKFISAKESSYITGSSIIVDGGYTSW